MADPLAFFDHFKLVPHTQGGVEYLGRDLLTRIAMFKEIKNDNIGLVDYTVKDGERADHIAQGYYGSDRLAWVVYLANDIIDPFHDWPLSVYDLEKFIISKYGSLDVAQAKVKHYRINWPEDESTISREQWLALTKQQQHYWNGILNYNGDVVYYERKPLDDIKSTNRIIKVPITNTDDYPFEVGMLVKDYQVTGINGEISYVGDDFLLLKHVEGTFSSGTLVNSLTGVNTGATYTAQTVIQNNLVDVSGYWAPVTFYEWEHEYNEKKKHIKLLDVSLLGMITDNLKDIVRR